MGLALTFQLGFHWLPPTPPPAAMLLGALCLPHPEWLSPTPGL